MHRNIPTQVTRSQLSFPKAGTMGTLASQALDASTRGACGSPGCDRGQMCDIVYAKSCNLVNFWRS